MNPTILVPTLTRTQLEDRTRAARAMYERGQADARRGVYDSGHAQDATFGATYRRGHQDAASRMEAERQAIQEELLQRRGVVR